MNIDLTGAKELPAGERTVEVMQLTGGPISVASHRSPMLKKTIVQLEPIRLGDGRIIWYAEYEGNKFHTWS